MSDDTKLDDMYDEYRQLTLKDLIYRRERRFKAADLNKDWKFTKDEYGTFLRPEDVPHMKDIVIEVSNKIFFCSNVSNMFNMVRQLALLNHFHNTLLFIYCICVTCYSNQVGTNIYVIVHNCL